MNDSPADTLNRAISLHQQGRLDEAEQLYAQILERDPYSPEALHFLGMAALQRGRADEAAELMERAVAEAPGYVDAHSNLGNLKLTQGDLAGARAAYELAVEIDPVHLASLNNLGVVLRLLDQPARSEERLRTAVKLAPELAMGWYNLGNTLQVRSAFEDAFSAFRRAVDLDPRMSEAWRRMGVNFYSRGHLDKAAAIYREWAAVDPDDPMPRHMLAALSGQDVPAQASPEYLTALFDRFAASFDVQLERIGYQVPALVGDWLAAAVGPGRGNLEVADLGCGTGLCGPYLRPYARHLTGVDLSRGMLDRARARGGYDQLVERDIVEWLEVDTAPIDLVVIADALEYFGELAPVFDAVAARLAAGGRGLFTVERFDSDEADCVLNVHGRYAHTRDFVEERLDNAGLVARRIEAVVLRRELNEDVAGWMVLATRRA